MRNFSFGATGPGYNPSDLSGDGLSAAQDMDAARMAASNSSPPLQSPPSMVPGPNGYPIQAGAPPMVPGPNGWPIQQAVAQATPNLQSLQDSDMAQRAAAASASMPLLPNSNDPTRLGQAQIAADPTGFAKQFLLKQPGNAIPNTLAMTGMGSPTSLQGYTPLGGIGSAPNTRVPIKLDTNITSDPAFQAIAAKDPDRAEFAYRALTGRSYQGDLKDAQDLRTQQISWGRSTVQKMIEDGAKYDPETGNLSVWQNTTPTGTIASMINGGQVAPIRQLMPATPEQKALFLQHYQAVTGQPLPTPPPNVRSAAQSLGSPQDKFMADPDVQAAVTAKEKTIGQPLNSRDKLDIATKVLNNKANASSGQGLLGQVTGTASNAVTNLLGFKTGTDILGSLNQPVDPNSLNSIGQKILQRGQIGAAIGSALVHHMMNPQVNQPSNPGPSNIIVPGPNLAPMSQREAEIYASFFPNGTTPSPAGAH